MERGAGVQKGRIRKDRNDEQQRSRVHLPMENPVSLPRSPHIKQEPSWRTGLTTLTYTPPARGKITILLSDADAENVKKILGSEK